MLSMMGQFRKNHHDAIESCELTSTSIVQNSDTVEASQNIHQNREDNKIAKRVLSTLECFIPTVYSIAI